MISRNKRWGALRWLIPAVLGGSWLLASGMEPWTPIAAPPETRSPNAIDPTSPPPLVAPRPLKDPTAGSLLKPAVENPETDPLGELAEDTPQVEIPVTQAFEPPSDEEREKDPLFQELKKVLLKKVDPSSEPPSLKAPAARDPIAAGQRANAISNRQWHAIELMLQSARLLDEEASQALASGNEGLADECSAVARRTRAEVVTLIQRERG